MKKIFRHPSRALGLLLPVLMVLVAPSIRDRVAAAKAAVSQGSAGDLEARNKNAFAIILGEIRATAADLMFVKTEFYIHNGIGYRPHLSYNQMATAGKVVAEGQEQDDGATLEDMGSGFQERTVGKKAAHASEHHEHEHDHHDHHHEGGWCPGGVPTLIRTAAEDFRGLIGSLERETKPFQDPKLPHEHGHTEELLPWYRLMTITDPHNLRGYMIGTMLLMFAEKPDEALSFIREGIEKNRDNPQAFRLYASLAQVYSKSRYHGEKLAGARLGRALAAAQTGYEMGKAVRPKEGKVGAARKGIVWTDDLENDFLFLARVVPILLERKGDLYHALRVANEVASLAPDDVATKRIVSRFRLEYHIARGLESARLLAGRAIEQFRIAIGKAALHKNALLPSSG